MAADLTESNGSNESENENSSSELHFCLVLDSSCMSWTVHAFGAVRMDLSSFEPTSHDQAPILIRGLCPLLFKLFTKKPSPLRALMPGSFINLKAVPNIAQFFNKHKIKLYIVFPQPFYPKALDSPTSS